MIKHSPEEIALINWNLKNYQLIYETVQKGPGGLRRDLIRLRHELDEQTSSSEGVPEVTEE